MSPSRPGNIILIVFDCLGAADLARLAGRLPTLTRFAQTAVCFSQAYTPSPQAGPARASLFTGLDLSAHGVWTDGVGLPARETTLTQRFADAGFRTALIGRRQLAGQSHWTTEHARPFEFDCFEWAHGPHHRARQNAYLTWLQAESPEIYAAIFPKQPNADDTTVPDAQADAMRTLDPALSFNSWVGTRLVAALSAHDLAEPFFGVAGFVVGQDQGGPPKPGQIGEGLEEAALEQADAAIARILAAVDPSDTLVAITSACGSGGAGQAPQHPMSNAALQVPLMVQFPGATPQTRADMVSTLDLAATILAAAGLRLPRRMQGRALLGDVSPPAPQDWALCRLRAPDAPLQTALIRGHLKLVMTHGDTAGQAPRYHLFDLSQDPQERNDLAQDPSRQLDLEMMIDALLDARVAREDRTEPRIASF